MQIDLDFARRGVVADAMLDILEHDEHNVGFVLRYVNRSRFDSARHRKTRETNIVLYVSLSLYLYVNREMARAGFEGMPHTFERGKRGDVENTSGHPQLHHRRHTRLVDASLEHRLCVDQTVKGVQIHRCEWGTVQSQG